MNNNTDNIINKLIKRKPNTLDRTSAILNHFKKIIPNNKGAPIKQQQVWSKMPIQQKIVKRIILKDNDNDGYPNKYDCRINNPKKDKSRPNKLIRERISRLPIYSYSGDIYNPGNYDPETGQRVSKPILESKTQGSKNLLKAIKQNPSLLTDIERTGSKIYMTEKEREIEPGTHAANVGKNIIMSRQSSPTHTSDILFHELKHSEQMNKPNWDKMVSNQSDKWTERPLELEAEQYKTEKLKERHGKSKYYDYILQADMEHRKLVEQGANQEQIKQFDEQAKKKILELREEKEQPKEDNLQLLDKQIFNSEDQYIYGYHGSSEAEKIKQEGFAKDKLRDKGTLYTAPADKTGYLMAKNYTGPRDTYYEGYDKPGINLQKSDTKKILKVKIPINKYISGEEFDKIRNKYKGSNDEYQQAVEEAKQQGYRGVLPSKDPKYDKQTTTFYPEDIQNIQTAEQPVSYDDQTGEPVFQGETK